MKSPSQKFDHLVVVMMENRSFDHMLGMLYTKDDPPHRGQTFDGVDGKQLTNPDPSNLNNLISVGAAQHWDGVQGSPNHDFTDVQWQLFWQPGQTITSALPTIPSPAHASMQGFVADYAFEYGNKYALADVMSYFPTYIADQPGLRVLPALARGFAVCDRWFASVPTMTLPNRSFCNAGTSHGFVDNGDPWEYNDSPTIFTSLRNSSEVKRSGIWPWRIYHDRRDRENNGGEGAHCLTVYIHWPELGPYRQDPCYRRSIECFEADAASGDLPAYSFIEPRITGYDTTRPLNDQHPDQDIRLGENFIHRIYSAIVNSDKVRDNTLLVITYDEHGGIYDHVSPHHHHVPAPRPPSPAPLTPPGPKSIQFDFTRLGVRVPAVIVSPFIPKHTVYHPATHWADHTTIIKTLTKRWELPPLTARDAAAPDLRELLTLDEPRTDFPHPSPWVIPLDQRSADEIPSNDLQRDFVQLVARAHGLPPPTPPRTVADVMAFLDSVPREEPGS